MNRMRTESMSGSEWMQALLAAQTHVRRMGCTPAYTAVYGSQNYGLSVDTQAYRSDMDVKCIVLPSLRELIAGSRPISTTIDAAGGQIDIKDIRVFVDSVGRMNPSYLECLMTQHSAATEDGECFGGMKACLPALLEERGTLLARACAGLFAQKEKQMCHPYPAAAEKIAAYGYDGKQVHHMYRLLLLMRSFVQSGGMQLVPPQETHALLLDLKLGRIPLAQARGLIDIWRPQMDALCAEAALRHGEPRGEALAQIRSLAHEAMYSRCRREAREEA